MMSRPTRWGDVGQGSSAPLPEEKGKQPLDETEENTWMGGEQEYEEGDEVFVDPDDYGSTLRSMFNKDGKYVYGMNLFSVTHYIGIMDSTVSRKTNIS
jgi:hypothetical protein